MTRTRTITMIDEECCTCGTPFALGRTFYEQRIIDHDWFYCPSGHAQKYTSESDVERERRLKEEAMSRAARQADRADGLERSLNSTKGVVTKLKKRASAGVCAFCHRTFQNVSEHVKSKHPATPEGI